MLAGGCLIGWVWEDGFVVVALALGFRDIEVWAFGWGAEKALDFIFSLNSGQ